MSDFFNSNNIEVFPSAYRTAVPSGKFTSEHNFINIINSITDIDSYVLRYENGILDAVLHGYFFSITVPISKTENPNLWLGIIVQQGGYRLVNFDTKAVNTLDSNSKFTGLAMFTSEPQQTVESGYIKYFLKVAENGNIINQIKFDTTSIRVSTNVDLKQELNNKQYCLKNGYGIDTIKSVKDDSVVKLDDKASNKLKSLEGILDDKKVTSGVGKSNQPVYFDSNGLAHPSTATLGKFDTTNLIAQNVYISNGELKEGPTTYASTLAPSSSDGKVGDVWFKYNS